MSTNIPTTIRTCPKCKNTYIYVTYCEDNTCKECGYKDTIRCNVSKSEFYNMTQEQVFELAEKTIGDKITDDEKQAIINGFEKTARENAIVQVKCPHCSSPDTSKISSGSRLLSALTFGIASSKMGKQRHCNTCGMNF